MGGSIIEPIIHNSGVCRLAIPVSSTCCGWADQAEISVDMRKLNGTILNGEALYEDVILPWITMMKLWLCNLTMNHHDEVMIM